MINIYLNTKPKNSPFLEKLKNIKLSDSVFHIIHSDLRQNVILNNYLSFSAYTFMTESLIEYLETQRSVNFRLCNSTTYGVLSFNEIFILVFIKLHPLYQEAFHIKHHFNMFISLLDTHISSLLHCISLPSVVTQSPPGQSNISY